MESRKNDSDVICIKKGFVPEEMLKVLNVKRKHLTSGLSISDLCKKEGVSRSSYYKYKDAFVIPETGNRTIASTARAVLASDPTASDAMSRGILDITCYAREIKPAVERVLGYPVAETTIMMALRRLTAKEA